VHLDLMRDKAKAFPSVEQPLAVTTARIWHCRYASLQAVASLRNVEVLVIGTYPDDTFTPLAGLKKLRDLRVVHFPRATDLEPLASLENLETLSLSSAPGWDASGKVLPVASLRPLACLSKLEHVELFNVRPSADGLAPLLQLRRLRSARLSRFKKEEAAEFYSASGVTDEFAPEPPFAAA
jgi:hypothetical protein